MSPTPSFESIPAIPIAMRYRDRTCLKCLNAIGTVKSYRLRQEICWQGQPATSWYRVLAGAASCSLHKTDGRRQIVDLLFTGDFFGITTCAEYDCTVTSISAGTALASYPRKSAEALVDANSYSTHEIRQVMSDARLRLQQQLLIVARITVQQKVRSFLLAMEERLTCGLGEPFLLPVSRYDVADYLAVAPESVSRVLTDLKQQGIIRLRGTREIQVLDRDALEGG